MSEETTKTEETLDRTKSANGQAKAAPATATKPAFKSRTPYKGGGRGGRRGRPARPKPEFDQKILDIRRVTRVVAGGRRFSFSVSMAIGNRKGSVGVGVGKAGDTSLAIQKAFNDAKRNMITIALTDTNSIKHEIEAKFNSARVTMLPNYGRGVVAGSAVRNIIELAGIKDVTGKVLSRSKNTLNIARATIKAFAPFSSPYKKPAPKTEASTLESTKGTDGQGEKSELKTKN